MLKKLRSKIEWIRSEKGRNLAFALIGQGGPTLLQLLFFISTARILGSDSTGLFFLVVAISVIGSSFVGFGSGGVVMREVSRDGAQANIVYGQAIGISLLTYPFVLPVVIFGSWYVTDGELNLVLIALVATADIFASRLLTTTWSLFIAREEQLRAAIIICVMPFTRIMFSFLVLLVEAQERLNYFMLSYFISSFVTLGVIIYIVKKIIGKFSITIKNFDYKSGSSFSLTWFNAAIQSECEKVLLGVFGNPSMVAVYSIAMRLMDGAAMPPRAARVAVQARFFRSGANGTAAIFKMTLRILPAIIVYGLCIWGGFFIFSTYIAMLFGTGFDLLSKILPVLGLLPLLRGVSEFGAEIFLSSDSPSVQAFTQTFITFVRLILGTYLISIFQIDGAIYTALIVTVLSGSILWGIALKKNSHLKM